MPLNSYILFEKNKKDWAFSVYKQKLAIVKHLTIVKYLRK